jgi:hypothetical protein
VRKRPELNLPALHLPGAAPVDKDLPVLPVEHLSVLDGRTLNLSVVLPAVPGSPDPVSARLLVAARPEPVRLAIAPKPAGDGRIRLSVTAAVDRQADAGGQAGAVPAGVHLLRLPDGSWPLLLGVTGPEGVEQRFALSGPPKIMADGPNDPSPEQPDGHRVRVAESALGTARLELGTDPESSAEVTEVELGWSRITLRGRLAGVPEGPVEAELVRREDGAARRLPARRDGELFEIAIAPVDLPGNAPGEQIWDVRVHPPGHGRAIRAARRRTDVRSPKLVFRMPARLLTADDGTAAWINPYWTPAGNLALRGGPAAPGREQ